MSGGNASVDPAKGGCESSGWRRQMQQAGEGMNCAVLAWDDFLAAAVLSDQNYLISSVRHCRVGCSKGNHDEPCEVP